MYTCVYFVIRPVKMPGLIFVVLVIVTAARLATPTESPYSLCTHAHLLSLIFVGGNFVTAKSTSKIKQISTPRKLLTIRCINAAKHRGTYTCTCTCA